MFSLLCEGSVDNKKLYEIGLENFYKRKYSVAADYLGQAADLDKSNIWARYYYVYSLAALGKKNEASKWLGSLSTLKGTSHYKQLVSILDIGKPEKVEKTKKESKQSKKQDKSPKTPKKESSIFDKFQELIDSEKYEEAVKQINNYLETYPKSGKSYQLLGLICLNKKDYKNSVENFKKAFSYGIKNFDSYFMAAEASVCIQNIDEALIFYEKASEINKKDILLKLAIADLFCKKANYSKASEIYKEVLKTDSNMIDAKVGLAKIELDRGFEEDALNQIESILEEHQDNAKARFLKAQIYSKQKDYVKAQEEARLASLYNESNIEYQVFYSLMKVRNFQIKEAIKEINQILIDYPDNVYALAALGEAYLTAGKEKEGRKALNKADNIKKIPETAQLLALTDFFKGNYDKAEENYKEYCKRTSDSPEALLEYAEFVEVKQDTNLSIAAYQKVIDKFSDTPFAERARQAIYKLKQSSSGLKKRSYGIAY